MGPLVLSCRPEGSTVIDPLGHSEVLDRDGGDGPLAELRMTREQPLGLGMRRSSRGRLVENASKVAGDGREDERALAL